VLLILSIVVLVIWLLGVPLLWRGIRSLHALTDQPIPSGDLPSVTVVIAARDEVQGIEAALRSVLALEYPQLEVIVVDDRSTDGTSQVLDKLAAESPRLRAVHLTQLPSRWIGKNHALHFGAAQAAGELLLFTDADIVFDAHALRKAVGYFQREQLDHLAITPDVHMRGFWASALFGFFALAFSIYARPWRVRDPRSRAAIGIGAFNLVRASAYHRIGGHTGIAMRPDDDLQLGFAIKRAGYRQDLLLGTKAVTVEWYPNLRAMIVGLEKNSFAAFNYSLLRLIAALTAQQIINFWPWLALFLTTGSTWWVNAAACLLTVIAWLVHYPAGPRDLRYAITHPLLSLLLAYIIARAALLTLKQGGIYWRETFYSLAELRGSAR
jgi:glycosyltransferase involved in cell wall biosynthesis